VTVSSRKQSKHFSSERGSKGSDCAAHYPTANMSAATKTENVITLKGSVAVVSEFFYCAINSILYQRGE
jgi:hypothetical protein